MTTVRLYVDRDHDSVMALADRLTAGAASWRDRTRWLAVVRGWVAESISAADTPMHAMYVAVVDDHVVGFVAVSTRMHFTGALDAYVGELVVNSDVERRGVGRMLLEAAETWARDQGFTTVTLDTGAANTAARAFYLAAGFVEEDIRLAKRLR